MDEKVELLKTTCATIKQLSDFAEKLAEDCGLDYTYYKFKNFHMDKDVDEFWQSSSASC